MSPGIGDSVSRREFLVLSGGALAGIAFGGFPAEADQSCGNPKYGGHLKIGERYHPVGLDPHRQINFIEIMNHMLMYNGLTSRGSLPEVKIFPSLAKEWDISENGLTYTFHLNEAKFHNGKEMTSADVKYSLDRVRDPKTGSPRRRDLRVIDSIDTIDRRTIRINLKESYGPMLYKLTVQVCPIIPEGTTYKKGVPPPGTGPFIFKEWKVNQYTHLIRNNHYFEKVPYERGLPFVDQVTVRGIPDATVRFTALRTGEIDWLTTLPLARVKRLLKSPPKGITVWVSLPLGRHQVIFNIRKTVLGKPNPFSNLLVRKAVAYAINKKEILQGANWGFGDILQGQLYNPREPWSVNVPDYKQDLSKARALLAEAGYPNGFKSFMITRPDDPRRHGAEVVVDQLKKVGIDLELKILATPEHTNALMRTHEFPIAYQVFSYRDDPDDGYYLYLHSKSPANPTGQVDPVLDGYLEEARRLVTREDRKKVYKKAVERIRETVPWIWTHSNNLPYAWRNEVKCACAPGEKNCWGFGGWFASANGGFKRIWLDR